jgi:ribose transport system ATP-binding protein
MSSEVSAEPGPAPAKRGFEFRGWMPLALMVVLVVAIGGYATSKSPEFLSSFNLNGLLIATVPLALISMGQLNVLLVGTFDVSVGALTTLCVVVMSFTMGAGGGWLHLTGGALAVVGIGVLVGVVNATLIEVLGLSAIIATLATLSVLQGLALQFRPVPSGDINYGVILALTKSWGFMPLSFIGVVVLAAIWDAWLFRSRGGLRARAVGMDETSARRLGMPSRLIRSGAFVVCSLMASVGALFLGAQIAIGDPRIALSSTLTSIAACIVGGASFLGGRGSFLGAVLGALFFYLIVNALPFLGLSPAYGQILIGGLTLLALIAYGGPALWSRLTTHIGELRRTRSDPQQQGAG